MSYAGDYGQQHHGYGSYDPYAQQGAAASYDPYAQQQQQHQAYQDPYAAQGGGYDQYAAQGYYAQPAADPYTQTKPAFVPPPNTQVCLAFCSCSVSQIVVQCANGSLLRRLFVGNRFCESGRFV
mmetsp:Transcript_15776/g.24541  ORF Transcript_15776/g.24541 Transcript_15776/m.24541 type:complete len:124 (+) Transcript_15776:471-842(+)